MSAVGMTAPERLGLEGLSVGRTVLSLERTLMSWIRTCLSLIGFGFTIYKFLQAADRSNALAIHENAPRTFGLALIFIGITSLALAMFQFKRAVTMITAGTDFKPGISLSLTTAGCVLAVGALALLNILVGLGNF